MTIEIIEKTNEDDLETYDSMIFDNKEKKLFIGIGINFFLQISTSFIVIFSSIKILNILNTGIEKLDNIENIIDKNIEILQNSLISKIKNITF
tara:strand:- start:6482 stop:6760 length:279 start_codon:yes stop_codon:yes gene_type:complete